DLIAAGRRTIRPIAKIYLEGLNMVVVTDRVPRIGEILIQQGATNRTQIEAALVEQRKRGEPIGEILIAQGLITREQLHHALLEQFKLQVMAGVISVAIAFGAPFQAAVA